MVARLYQPVTGATPEPAKFGILNSKTLARVGNFPDRWETGITIDSYACNSEVRIVNICNTSQTVSSSQPSEGNYSVIPYAVQAEYECSTFGFEANDYFEKAKLALELCQGKAIEREFWTGALAKQDATLDVEGLPNPNRYLASATAVDVTPTPGTAVKPALGLALLEQAIADCGCGASGTIHATRGVTSVLSKRLDVVDDHLETSLGSLFVSGSGYTGTGPNGTSPGAGKAWMYATGQVSVVLGEAELITDKLNQATNVLINSVSATAERFVAAGWDGCCHYGVLVDLSLDYS